MSWFTTETFRPAFDRGTPKISYGIPFPEACKKHIDSTLNASRVYIIASNSLATKTDNLDRLKAALGSKVVGVRVGIKPHTPWTDVLEIVNEARTLDIDCLITLGAGSLTDGAKIVRFALTNGATSIDELATLLDGGKEPTIPLICIPTSLSGGEYQSLAGGTDTKGQKKPFYPKRDPDIVIQDPQLTTTTPEWVWLSTGIRAVDHCIETMCSLQSNDKGDTAAEKGLRALVPGLLKCKENPTDLEARHACQMGVILAMTAVSTGVPMGGSHAIGHQLGPMGVGHGETSCILLPSVCKYNAKVNEDRQRKILQTLGIKKGDLGDALDEIIRQLGMPLFMTLG
ncbi:MAG: hypothetical protein Q9227_006622 [Pyrenula ochraceoflavens]